MKNVKLNAKHKAFAEEYVKSHNQTLAYQAAYPTCTNPKAACSAATRLLKNVNIQAYIKELEEKSTNSSIATAAEVKEFLTNVMNGVEGDERRVDVRVKAAELLGKTYGMFVEKLEVKERVDIATTLKNARMRAIKNGGGRQ